MRNAGLRHNSHMGIQSLVSLGTEQANHRAFKQHAMEDGGVFWLSDQPVEQAIFYLPMSVMEQSWLNSPERSEIYGSFQATAGYTQARNPNGACSIERGIHCISLTRGLVLHLLRICSVVASHPSLFKDFPPGGVALPDKLRVDDWFHWDETAEKALFFELALPNIINASFRKRLALLLLFDALHVAWLHEAFHVYLGHAGYFRHSGRLRMNEQESTIDAPGVEDALYQALEFEADHTAMRMVTDLAQKHADPIYRMLAPEIGFEQRLGILLMAGCFLTLGWSALAAFNKQHSKIHPPPTVRFYTMILAHSDRSETYMHKDRILHVQRWVFNQFSHLLNVDPFFKPLAQLGNPGEQESADELIDKLKEILVSKGDDLKPYRFD